MSFHKEFDILENDIEKYREAAKDNYLKVEECTQGDYDGWLNKCPITFDSYQRATTWSGRFPEKLPDYIYTGMGLAGESGEYVGKLSKIFRDKNGIISDEDKQKLAAELGDCLYYLAASSQCLGLSLSDIAKQNQSKLVGRIKRNTIRGDGDDR